MSLSGRKLYAEIRRRETKARERASRTRGKVGELRLDLAKQMAERGEALVNLAQKFLPEVTEEAIGKTFKDIRAELHDVLHRRDARLDQLNQALEQLEVESQRLDLALETTTEQLEQKVAEQTQLEAKLRDTLEADTEFQRLSTEAARAEVALTRNEERIEEIRREAKRKLPAYREDRLFMYLQKRRWGTTDYASRGIIKRLDRWVANLVHFADNNESFQFLSITPKLVEQEIERRREEFDELMQMVERLQAATAMELGLPKIEAEAETLDQEHRGLADAIEDADGRRESYREEYAAIEMHRGRFYSEAISRFRRFLDETRTSRLEREARRTPDPEDDKLVETIEDADRSIDRLKDEVEDVEDLLAEADRQSREFESIATKFRARGFDRGDSSFKGDPEDDLEDFSRGRLSERSLWEKLKGKQRTQRRRRSPFSDFGTSIGRAASHPASRVLFEAMGNAVSGMLRGAARRSVGRRSRGWSGGWGGGGSRGGSRSSSRGGRGFKVTGRF